MPEQIFRIPCIDPDFINTQHYKCVYFITGSHLLHCIITLALERTDSRSTMSIKNFFQFSANELIKGTRIYFSDFKGKVVLVENVASL